MMKTIPDKRTFYNLAMLGKFGNVPHMWWDYESFMSSGVGFNQLGIRSLIPGDGRFRPFVDVDDIPQALEDLRFLPGEYILSETLPEGCQRIQGELSYIDGVLAFYHTYRPKPMRSALVLGGKHAYGIHAMGLLRQYADPASVEDIMDILDQYSRGGVIETCAEITVTSKPFGIFPRRNTIVWEIRQY